MNTDTTLELKPCPFCGGEADCQISTSEWQLFEVSCHTKGCRGNSQEADFVDIISVAVRAWNTIAEG